METIFQSAEGIMAFISSLLGGTGFIGVLLAAISNNRTNRKYTASVAANNSKDLQIMELDNKVERLVDAIGLMMSAFTTSQLASKALDAPTKQLIAGIAQQTEALCSVKLDTTVNKALEALTNLDAINITEERKNEIMEQTEKAQAVLDGIKKVASNVNDIILDN